MEEKWIILLADTLSGEGLILEQRDTENKFNFVSNFPESAIEKQYGIIFR